MQTCNGTPLYFCILYGVFFPVCHGLGDCMYVHVYCRFVTHWTLYKLYIVFPRCLMYYAVPPFAGLPGHQRVIPGLGGTS